MYQLDSSTVPNWQAVVKHWFPSAISANCPFCNALVSFRPEQHHYDQTRETIASTASCPACQQRVHIWAVKPGTASDASKQGCERLTMFPVPRCSRKPIGGTDSMPHRVRLAYLSAFKNFEAGIWSSVGSECGRALEGVVRKLLSEEHHKKKLYEKIEALSNSPDVGKPLRELAHGVREGRNIGAHFDPEKELDQETAEVLLDLTEFLLTYLFTLEETVGQLNERIAKLGDSSVDDSTRAEYVAVQ